MKKSVLVMSLALFMVACAPISKEAKREIRRPVNCASAEEHIRSLEAQKADTEEQILSGVVAVLPGSMIVGVFTGEQDDRIAVASGDYNEAIDLRIARIKQTCRP